MTTAFTALPGNVAGLASCPAMRGSAARLNQHSQAGNQTARPSKRTGVRFEALPLTREEHPMGIFSKYSDEATGMASASGVARYYNKPVPCDLTSEGEAALDAGAGD